MSEERTEMINALKEIFIPVIREKDFKGTFPHFRRTKSGRTNLLTFQFDKYGGGFVIELANWHEPDFKTSWGKEIPLNKLTAHDLNERLRIYPDSIKEDKGTDSWFRYDKAHMTDNGNKYEQLAKKVIERLPLMEQYWDKE
ncbi:DUF4304 domain-containing protein [Rufibacter psychrotolerans]|uniref:DUF4304 domain-containing protein n=1 Tax=Rufibacter psychrotolerans TaxID=2812556 RepID=UPI0019684FF2|nr:DUF4304 domain-containing protein [Rufibacter sp. SYSU D00308]